LNFLGWGLGKAQKTFDDLSHMIIPFPWSKGLNEFQEVDIYPTIHHQTCGNSPIAAMHLERSKVISDRGCRLILKSAFRWTPKYFKMKREGDIAEGDSGVIWFIGLS